MAKLIYNQVAKNIKDSAFMPLAFMAVTLVLVITINMGIEDYMTSYIGYSTYPTTKILGYVVWLVAGLPQAIQMVMSYIVIGMVKATPEERTFYGFDLVRLAAMFWFLAYLIDVAWDYGAKSAEFIAAGAPMWDLWIIQIYPQALVESAILYGLLSEVLTSIFGALWVEMLKEGAVDELVGVGHDIGNGIGSIVGLFTSLFRAISGGFFSGLKANSGDGQQRNQNQNNRNGHNRNNR